MTKINLLKLGGDGGGNAASYIGPSRHNLAPPPPNIIGLSQHTLYKCLGGGARSNLLSPS